MSRSDTFSQEDLYSEPFSYSRDGSPYARRHSGSQKGARSDGHSQENIFDMNYTDESACVKRHDSEKPSQKVRPSAYAQDNQYEPQCMSDTADNSSLEAMEADLAELMEQVVGKQKEKSALPPPAAFCPNVPHTQTRQRDHRKEKSANSALPGYPSEHWAQTQPIGQPKEKSANAAAVSYPCQHGKQTQPRDQQEKSANSAIPVYPSDSLQLNSVTQQLIDGDEVLQPPSPPYASEVRYTKPPPPQLYSNDLSQTSEVTQGKKGRPRMLSLFKTAPGSLFSSRRGSLDLSAAEHNRKEQKGARKKTN